MSTQQLANCNHTARVPNYIEETIVRELSDIIPQKCYKKEACSIAPAAPYAVTKARHCDFRRWRNPSVGRAVSDEYVQTTSALILIVWSWRE
jgi:hypothetical protein